MLTEVFVVQSFKGIETFEGIRQEYTVVIGLNYDSPFLLNALTLKRYGKPDVKLLTM